MPKVMTDPPAGRPHEWSEPECLRVVDWLATLPLAELRRRQGLISAQIKAAFEQRHDRALADLRVMDDLHFSAVDRGH